MQKSPHMLIEGIIIAAYAGGHQRARSSTSAASTSCRPTSSTRRSPRPRAAGYIGERHPRLGLLAVARACTAARAPTSAARRPALLDSLEGKRGNPRLKPPFPANQGLYQGPTLINNVETLATVPHDHPHGRRGVRQARRRRARPAPSSCRSPATCSRPGNYEIELGMPSREIIYGLAGGPPEGREVKLWFPGGSSSPVLTKDDLDLAYDFDTMAKAGSMLGSGAIIVVDDSTSGRRRRAEDGEVLPPRVLRQVHAVPRGHQLDGQDARADRRRRGDADGPRHHGLRPGATSSATACACWATRWRCRSARWSPSSATSSRPTSRRARARNELATTDEAPPELPLIQGALA